MNIIEKIYIYILIVSFVFLVITLCLFLFKVYIYIDASVFASIMLFYAIPFIVLKKRIRQDNDEMIKEINRRSILIALQITWVFIVLAIVFFAILNKEYIKTKYVELLLFAGVWLIITVRAITTLHFFRKGIAK